MGVDEALECVAHLFLQVLQEASQIRCRKVRKAWSCDTSFAVSYTILLSMVVRPLILNMYFGQPGSIVEVLKAIAGEDHMRRSKRVRACISVML